MLSVTQIERFSLTACPETSGIIRLRRKAIFSRFFGIQIAQLRFNKEKNEYLVKVYDAFGKKVMKQKIREKKQSINIGHLPKGTYILSIDSGDLTGVKKVVYR